MEIDCLIKIWDVEQGEEKVTLEGHTNAVYSIQVSLKTIELKQVILFWVYIG